MTRFRPESTVLLAAVLALAAITAQAATAVTMKPYVARYQVSYRGLSGGQIEATFKPGATPGQWIYETHAFPNVFGRLAVSPAAHERSTMIIGPAGVQPLAFEFDDGSDASTKDVVHTFDWTARKVSGMAKGKAFVLDVTPGAQNTASVQAAMMVERLNGRMPSAFRILTGKNLRDYRYWMEGTQQIVTPYGQVEAEVWASQGVGSDRVSKVWHAPSLGFVPVQAIQYRKGTPEVQMKLVALQR
jgi:hypothetical protein